MGSVHLDGLGLAVAEADFAVQPCLIDGGRSSRMDDVAAPWPNPNVRPPRVGA
ncbi:hypothetical protein Sinac_3396 [Singulisphaera acidiphila DSM 18658]|uniref:Uncharacterized protein n=1 Tax=Singulisphaera acidiphila (strain ATCC BAA-1392 / DSM 18658 / VKM B-2454 / MOB10) TaxID=886293 RepID=L0DEH5_SINAD|nr:hypothetical protein Sinac_3396 [Singulisphaera acidiphila DSM 18658]